MSGYTADVLNSAQSLADHAGRPGPGRIEKDDVELAIQVRRRYEFFEAPPRDVSRLCNSLILTKQYLAALAHDLNSQPLPVLPESFEVVRLPPPHQRLAEVNFDLVPDSGIVLAEEDEDSEESEDEEDEEEDEDEPKSDGEEGAKINGQDDADGEDEEMEEVGLEPQRQERQVDEDYDE
jgi:transcription initiation factor TFIID subunit 9B